MGNARIPPPDFSRPPRFRDLTDLEKAKLTNGCGPKGGWVSVPDFMFTASCDMHDFQYWLGCSEADRRGADRQFYDAMRMDAYRVDSAWTRWRYAMWAWTYYQAVRRGGKAFFYYAVQPRGWRALYEAMGYSDKGTPWEGTKERPKEVT